MSLILNQIDVNVSTMDEELFGYIENIVFAAEDSGFTVARLKEPRKAELTCIVGKMPGMQPGETIRCRGSWKHHPQHGRQFEVASFDLQAPSDLLGIQKYLESGMVKGVGPVYAERIVKKFGLDTLQIIDETPERLYEVEGLGHKRIEAVRSCWSQQRSIREVMVFLRGHGVSPGFAQKIYKTYGDQSIEKVKDNPYALAKEISGIGFKSADAIARGLGIPLHATIRLEAGIEHVLWEFSNEGHVCYSKELFLPEAQAILQVENSHISERLELLIQNGIIIEEDGLIWVKPLYLAELGIAREMARLLMAPSLVRSVNVEKAVDWVQEKIGIKLAEQQSAAIAHAMNDKVHIITGGPGTGKSTITRAILILSEQLTKRIILAAPTGRAAKRMSEITGKKASTIHSLLEMDFQAGGKFKRDRNNPLECDLIIIDEVSMVDTQLMYNLLKAVPSSSRVVLIGDVDQLPSVGPGNVLKDMIGSEQINVTRLTEIFRQAAGSKIVTNAHRVNMGEFPDISSQGKSDFIYMEAESPDEILSIVIDLVKTSLSKRYRFHRFDDIQVLAPMKKGIIGIENLNMQLQKELNPSPTPLIRMGRSFHLGDKVMQIRNNYQKFVFNGDVGRIAEIDTTDQKITVLFEDKRVDYEFSEMDELILAYAVSIHKYQGSECPCIIIPIHTSHFKLLCRNLLYTGITRGKKLVILVGTKKAIAIAVHNDDVQKRFTGLQNILKTTIGKG